MSAPLSLSTMWARGRYEDLYDFSCDACDWGFTAVEANAFVTSMDALERLAAGPLPLSSLHNPAPNVRVARGVSAYDLNLGALDEDERVEALSHARSTVDLASRLGARAVVLHMGHIPIGRAREKRINELWHAGRMESDEYFAIQDAVPGIRNGVEALHLERALETLRNLEDLARARGILLGLETRHNLHEMPNVAEMDVMLRVSDPAVVGYWHDTGHAAMQERCGSTTHEEWLRRHSGRLIGAHLHDVNSERDHQCPGTGRLDWSMVSRYLPASAIRVCELGEWNGQECVAQAPAFLAHMGVLAPSGVDSRIR